MGEKEDTCVRQLDSWDKKGEMRAKPNEKKYDDDA